MQQRAIFERRPGGRSGIAAGWLYYGVTHRRQTSSIRQSSPNILLVCETLQQHGTEGVLQELDAGQHLLKSSHLGDMRLWDKTGCDGLIDMNMWHVDVPA